MSIGLAKLNKLQFLDEARGIAILLVILVHTAQSFPLLEGGVKYVSKFGQLGVQLFFVVSAYTLCLTFSRRAGEPLPWISFYLRRIFRIAPLYWFGIAIYFGLNLFRHLNLNDESIWFYPYTLDNVLSNVFFIHGFVESANNSVVPGGWSIGTEMAFYVIFPLIYSFISHFSRISDQFFALFGLMIVSIIVNILTSLYCPSAVFGGVVHNNSFQYFSLLNQFPVFLMGIFGFILHHRLKSSVEGKIPTYIVSTALLVLLVPILLLWFNKLDFSFILIPTLSGIFFVIFVDILSRSRIQLNWLAKIGQVSFSMYIIHFVLAWYVLRYLNKHGLLTMLNYMPLELLFFLSLIAVVALTYCAAYYTENFIERKGVLQGNALIARLQQRSS